MSPLQPPSPAHRPLDPDDLLACGPLRRLGRNVIVLRETTSTNQLLLDHAHELPDGTLATAEYQTAGRGRFGRRWHAPRGATIALSVLLHEPADSPLVADIWLRAAIAAARAIEAMLPLTVDLRWPNDLQLAGRKVGGVLVESRPVAPRIGRPARGVPSTGPDRALVVGIGINCLQQRGHFPPELRGRATSLEIESTQPVDRPGLAGRLVAELDAVVTDRTPDAELRDEYARRCHDLGQRVTLIENARSYRGTVVEIDRDGGLIVQLDDGGRRHFASATTTRGETV